MFTFQIVQLFFVLKQSNKVYGNKSVLKAFKNNQIQLFSKTVLFLLKPFEMNRSNVQENSCVNNQGQSLELIAQLKNKCSHFSEKATGKFYRAKYKRPVILILIALSNKPLQLVTKVVTFKPVFPHFISSVITPVSLSLFVIVP